jgi:hypothetical protein
MPAGYLLRKAQEAERRAAAPCDRCGHAKGDHRLLERETFDAAATEEAGFIVYRPNPDYEPLTFHCGAEGCGCRLVAS